MTRIFSEKNSFTAGEISSELHARSQLRAYQNGAKELRNVLLLPTGGIRRRPGLSHVQTLAGPGRLIPIELGNDQSCIMFLYGDGFHIYRHGVEVTTVRGGPWHDDILSQIAWIQNGESLYLTHPDMRPCRIYRHMSDSGSERWLIGSMAFHREERRTPSYPYTVTASVVDEPFYRFFDKEATMTIVSTGIQTSYRGRQRVRRREVIVECSKPFFTEDHTIDTRLVIDGLQLDIHECIETRNIIGARSTTTGRLRTHRRAKAWVLGHRIRTRDGQTTISTDVQPYINRPSVNWQESAFSKMRGWPKCCVFHQSRMVIGGSRDVPNRIWMSQPFNHGNFDAKLGQADGAIIFDLLSERDQTIHALFSGQHLQIFTSSGEWAVTDNNILSPTTINVKNQSRIGIFNRRYLPVSNVDGATVFINKSGRQVHEFIYTDIDKMYQSTDLALLSSHMIHDPVDQVFDQTRHHLYVVLADGTMAVATIHRAEHVTGWTHIETKGKFLSITVIGEDVYVLVQRPVQNGSDTYTIERFDESVLFDNAKSVTANPAKSQWPEFRYLAKSRGTQIIVDGIFSGAKDFDENGDIHLASPARQCQMGIAYHHTVTPLPLETKYLRTRLIEAVFHVHATTAMRVDTGHGYRDISFFILNQSKIGRPPNPYTGTVRCRGFGWSRGEKPLWQIRQDAPLPFTLLSTTTQTKATR